MLTPEVCRKARLSRDVRFDGKFFTAVKTTGIYCRTICPVYPPKEENVVYYATAVSAAHDGYRPCLRCRPDSAPGSPAWKGVGATFERALKLIEQGYLQQASVPKLAERLGVSDRYLRKLFKQQLSVSPKTYALYQQCLFAKKLLHQTSLPVTQIALASGFDSIRRFNDCFKTMLHLTPSQMRRRVTTQSKVLTLDLHYRPPFNWRHMQHFLQSRLISKMEWCDETSYGRTFTWQDVRGNFTATHCAKDNKFRVNVELDDISKLNQVICNIRRVLDLDVDLATIEQEFSSTFGECLPLNTGIRLPGIWQLYEAGIRAILGQQVSVVAAKNLVSKFVEQLGEQHGEYHYFPTPDAVIKSDLSFFKMPQARKNTVLAFSQHFVSALQPDDTEQWHQIKGIGPWTIDYAKMRGLSDPDILLASDLGVKKALNNIDVNVTLNDAAPWRSYLTFQLWNKL